MSLINQMLKDLEQRSRHSVAPEITLSGLFASDVADDSNKTHFILIAIAISIVLIMSSVYLYNRKADQHLMQSISHQQAMIATTKVQAEKTISSDNSHASVAATQSILTGITLQTQKDATYLEFLLNQNTHYLLETADNQNKLIISLENTNLIANLPPLDYMGSAIKGMEITNDPRGGLIVTLTLNDNTELQRIDLANQENGTAALQIDILSKKTPEKLASENISASTSQKFYVKRSAEQFNIEQQYKNALNSAGLGEFNKSIQMLTTLLEGHPDFVDARESLIAILMQHGNLSKAKQILSAGMDENPNYAPYIQLQAQMLINEGKSNRALDLLERAAPPLEQNPDYHAMIAALYQNTGKSELSAKLYSQLLQQHPNKGLWWMGLAIALESVGNPSQAKEAYLRARNSSGLTPESTAFIQTRIDSI